jgi:hypothetical protein
MDDEERSARSVGFEVFAPVVTKSTIFSIQRCHNTFKYTSLMELSPSLEAANCAATQELHSIY